MRDESWASTELIRSLSPWPVHFLNTSFGMKTMLIVHSWRCFKLDESLVEICLKQTLGVLFMVANGDGRKERGEEEE